MIDLKKKIIIILRFSEEIIPTVNNDIHMQHLISTVEAIPGRVVQDIHKDVDTQLPIQVFLEYLQ
jgi:hypothetical protein